MVQAKLNYLHANNKRQKKGFLKLEFTKNVFEEIHKNKSLKWLYVD